MKLVPELQRRDRVKNRVRSTYVSVEPAHRRIPVKGVSAVFMTVIRVCVCELLNSPFI